MISLQSKKLYRPKRRFGAISRWGCQAAKGTRAWLPWVLLFAYCSPSHPEPDVAATAAAYYEVYRARTDFDAFLSFYADDIVLEDMVNGDRIVGKAAFSEFFDWSNPDVTRLEPDAFVVNELIVAENKVVAKGYFTPFLWKDTDVEAMQFTTLLTFNDAGKITKHVDWINYPSTLVDYTTRKNSNDWLR